MTSRAAYLVILVLLFALPLIFGGCSDAPDEDDIIPLVENAVGKQDSAFHPQSVSVIAINKGAQGYWAHVKGDINCTRSDYFQAGARSFLPSDTYRSGRTYPFDHYVRLLKQNDEWSLVEVTQNKPTDIQN